MKKKLPILVLLFLATFMILNIPTASAAMEDGLIAYYPFDGNALDASGNDNDGTEYGALKYKQGIKGDSASFDGIDDYIRVPSDPSLNPVDQLSISFWVKVEGFTNVWSPIVHKGGPVLSGYSNREYTVWLQDTSSFLLSSAGDNSSQYYKYACCAILDHWTHYVGIIDRQNHRLEVYVDRILKVDVNDSYSTFNNNNEDLLFGWTEEINSAYSPFKGRIDELRIYNRALTEYEVMALYEENSLAITQPMKTIFESSFDAGLDGWTGHPSELSWRASGGNQDGYAYWHDIGADSRALSAPSKFLGDWSALNGVGVISFDKKIISTGNYTYRGYIRASIAGPGGIASWRGPRGPHICPNQPTCNWTTYVAPLMESQWTVSSGSWNDLLADVTSFKISPELYANVCCGSEISGFDNIHLAGPGPSTDTEVLGATLQIPSNYEFTIEQNAQEEFSIQLMNPSDDSQSATMEVINPHSGLTVLMTSPNPITLTPNDVQNIPLFIFAGSMPVGVYDDLLLKLMVENGETLYSNIKVTIVGLGTGNLPDLSISSQDIQLSDYTLGESATLNTVIHNKGQSTASNVQVQFYEFGSLLGETVLDEVPAEGNGTASITSPISTSGEHLIRVVVDLSDTIDELDENNNEAVRMIKIGSPAPVPGSILVTGSLPSKVYTNELFTISGRAVYDVYVDGVRYTNYVVKGGSVQITIKDDAGNEWVYGGVHTDTNGYFARTVQAPATIGTYQISMTVTDGTLSGKRDLLFFVTERTPLPPLPQPSYGDGSWIYVPASSTSPAKWNWVWTNPPVNAPVSETDLRVFSENIHFSRFNPEAGEEITIFAEIKYWATSTDLVAPDVPVNFYVTYPGTPKMKIGETVINSLSVGAPDFGSRYVYTSWKSREEGFHIAEVEIDPSYVEENNLNNAATRAIIVGRLQNQQGAIAGQVTDPWGGVANIMIELYDSSGTTLLENKLTDDTGFYLFENVPVDDYQVHIVKPEDHLVDAETKPAEVTDRLVTEVDFHLIGLELPVAAAGGPYIGSVGAPIMLDASGSRDTDGQIVTYQWDCDDDGFYELTTSFPTLEHTWNDAYDGTIGLLVTDNDGLSATDTAAVEIAVSDQELCGDLDADGDVDGDDRNILRSAFNTRVEDAGFILEADYDGDGLISYNDYREWYVCYEAFIAP